MEYDIEYKISFNPTEEQITEVEKWLIEEKKTSDEGFYCNWKLFVIHIKNKNVQFNKQSQGDRFWNLEHF